MKLESTLKKGLALMGLIAMVAALVGVTPAAIQAAPVAQTVNLLNSGFEAFQSSGRASNWMLRRATTRSHQTGRRSQIRLWFTAASFRSMWAINMNPGMRVRIRRWAALRQAAR